MRISSDNTLMIGDARQYMGQDLMRALEGVIDRNQNKEQYYILVAAKPHPDNPKQINTTIVLRSEKPPRMLGTMCFHIDNKKGRARRLWVLPLDRYQPVYIPGEQFVPEIAQSAKGMPILN